MHPCTSHIHVGSGGRGAPFLSFQSFLHLFLYCLQFCTIYNVLYTFHTTPELPGVSTLLFYSFWCFYNLCIYIYILYSVNLNALASNYISEKYMAAMAKQIERDYVASIAL